MVIYSVVCGCNFFMCRGVDRGVGEGWRCGDGVILRGGGYVEDMPMMRLGWVCEGRWGRLAGEVPDKEKPCKVVSCRALGWEVGLEPTTSRSTIWRSNQLNYAHRTEVILLSKPGAKVRCFYKLTKIFFVVVRKVL